MPSTRDRLNSTSDAIDATRAQRHAIDAWPVEGKDGRRLKYRGRGAPQDRDVGRGRADGLSRMQRDVVERPRERRERGVRDVAGHVEHVGLPAGPGRDEPLREAAVVREQQQARRGLVEAADGAEPVERPSFFELCIVPRVPGRGFTIADVYSTGVEFQVRRGDGDFCRRALRCRRDPVKAPHVLTRARAAETPAAGRRRPTSPSRRAASRSRRACVVVLVPFTPSSRRCDSNLCNAK